MKLNAKDAFLVMAASVFGSGREKGVERFCSIGPHGPERVQDPSV